MAFWKNITEGTDTPTNATNLSRAERYLEAVAGANGDFYVDIDGADGLEAGDILRIAFPAATNSVSEARLSIDGASGTFRNITFDTTNNISVVAKYIENDSVTLRYDGTTFKALDVDTGWIEPISYKSGYSSTTVAARRIGNSVFWRGTLTRSTNIAADSAVVTFEEAFRPEVAYYNVNMGTGITYTKNEYRTDNTLAITANPSGTTTFLILTANYVGV